MNFNKAINLQKLMPHKQIFFDTIHNCYRLICPSSLYEYQDENGKWRKRRNPETLILAS